MATLNFPANTDVGNQYTFATRTWVFNGKGWQVAQPALQVGLGFALVAELILTELVDLQPMDSTWALVNYI